MSIKRAILAYKTTASATTPAIDTMIELLNEMSSLLGNMANAQEPDKETLKNLQHALFELMAAVDQRTEEGKRLVLLYIFLNQQLINVQLYGQIELLEEVQLHIDQLGEAWTEARTNQRRQRFVTDLL